MLLCTVLAASLACCCAICREHGLETEQVLPYPEGEAVKVVEVARVEEAAAAGPTRSPAAIAAVAAGARRGLEVRMVSLLLCRAGEHAGDECALGEQEEHQDGQDRDDDRQ